MTEPDHAETQIDPLDIRRAFSAFPSGVTALAALVGDEPTVLISSSFTVGVSQDPPLVMFAVQHTSTTWPELAAAPTLGVSFLGTEHGEVARQLAAKDRSVRFRGVATSVNARGAVFLERAPVWLECTVEHVYPAGDHDIVVLRVIGLDTRFEHDPLVWHRSGFTRIAE